MLDLQKANLWKRISAALLDLILLFILAVGAALLLSYMLDYDGYAKQLEDRYTAVEREYGLSLDLTEEEYNALSEGEREAYDKALNALNEDQTAAYAYGMMINLSFLMITFSILIAYLLLEFLVPLLFGNGQTFGKKIFGIAVMQSDGVRLSSVLLFARTVLGKFAVETMVPAYIILMIFLGFLGFGGTLLIGILLAVQLFLFAFTKGHTLIHDKLSQTVTVDLASQMIFDTREELVAYKTKLHKEQIDQIES
ncbi:MAG: RDD family protein [Clostridia bacterium]|nr:RDD family protein [Clostridia bacterium]